VSLSPFEQTIIGASIGAAAAIIGGWLGAWWQTNRAAKIARNIRREERREQGLLELNAKATEVRDRIGAIYREAERGQTPAQFTQSRQLFDELTQAWDGSWSRMVYDQPVIKSFTSLAVALREDLPGDDTVAYVQNLSANVNGAGQRFVRGLGHVLGLLDELRKVVEAQLAGLLRR
jgi:hypothetical protein